MKYYLKDSGDVRNLANRTEPEGTSAPFFQDSCVKRIELDKPAVAVSVVHKLTRSGEATSLV
jgi:hypothetical protein